MRDWKYAERLNQSPARHWIAFPKIVCTQIVLWLNSPSFDCNRRFCYWLRTRVRTWTIVFVELCVLACAITIPRILGESRNRARVSINQNKWIEHETKRLPRQRTTFTFTRAHTQTNEYDMEEKKMCKQTACVHIIIYLSYDNVTKAAYLPCLRLLRIVPVAMMTSP